MGGGRWWCWWWCCEKLRLVTRATLFGLSLSLPPSTQRRRSPTFAPYHCIIPIPHCTFNHPSRTTCSIRDSLKRERACTPFKGTTHFLLNPPSNTIKLAHKLHTVWVLSAHTGTRCRHQKTSVVRILANSPSISNLSTWMSSLPYLITPLSCGVRYPHMNHFLSLPSTTMMSTTRRRT
jgi:hypothetical protein